MADEFGQTGTEAPTPRRREESRQQGRVAFSVELTTGLLVLAGVAALWFGAGSVGSGLLQDLRGDLRSIHRADYGPEQVQALFIALFERALGTVGYFLGFMVIVGVLAGVLQVGFLISPELVALRWEKLSIVTGWSRIVSLSAAMRGLVTFVKIALVGATAVWILHSRAPQIALLAQGGLAEGVSQAWNLILRLSLALAAVLVLIGLADYLFQR